ncbi:MAG: T9SS type A sorting domain-containing protein [Bacteroidetes bacterium]|nr:T9SS type A sorting domain-containing protein [Bacteroidota bacterium]
MSKIVPVRIGDDVSAPYLFPNPVRDQTYLIINSEENKNWMVEIFDLAGKLIYTETVSLQKGNNTVPISLHEIPPGVYFFRNGVEAIKLLKY